MHYKQLFSKLQVLEYIRETDDLIFAALVKCCVSSNMSHLRHIGATVVLQAGVPQIAECRKIIGAKWPDEDFTRVIVAVVIAWLLDRYIRDVLRGHKLELIDLDACLRKQEYFIGRAAARQLGVL